MKLLQQKFAAELKEQTGLPIAFARQEASNHFLATRGVGQCLSANCCPAATEKPVSPDSPCVNRTAGKTGQIALTGGTGPFFYSKETARVATIWSAASVAALD